jgi:polysaccharide biosynthesis transport protein
MKFTLIYFIRLFLRHIFLIIAVPVFMAASVFLLTKDTPRTYITQTTVYTSLATGSSIDVAGFTFNTVNTQFDNLMNVIRSRATLEKTGLSLFASHLLLEKADPLIIQENHLQGIMQYVPDEVKNLKVPGDFEKTLLNLQKYKDSIANNFVYNLVNNSGSYYDAGTISAKLRVRRIQTSDNIELTYESNDAGVCQQTLVYLVKVYSQNYLANQHVQTDNAVTYFENEVARAAERLQAAEDELLQFNQTNQIINYEEQSKFIAARKEQFEMGFQEVLKQNAAAKAVIDLLEKKMSPEEKRRIASSELISLRRDLAKVNQNLALEPYTQSDEKNSVTQARIQSLSQKSFELKQKMKMVVDSLYQFTNGVTSVPTNNIMTDWISNVIEFEGTNAQIATLTRLRDDFAKIYAQYAPMGAMMRRLERKINVAEDEYISLVKNLGLAKLKQQSVESSSANTVIDPAFYPLNPQPDKRKMMIMAASVAGLIMILFLILVLDLMDSSLRNAEKTERDTGLSVESIFPAIRTKKNKKIDTAFLEKKSIEAITRKLILYSVTAKKDNSPVTCFAFSTLDGEGKSFLLHRIADDLSRIGHKVLLLLPHEPESRGDNGYDCAQYIRANDFYRISSLRGLQVADFLPDWDSYHFIFVEFPGILNSSFPVNLFKTADHCFLVCRANRSWSKADANILAEILAVTDPVKPRILLNGVALLEMETIVGDLPRKRSFLRRLLKRILTRQFQS